MNPVSVIEGKRPIVLGQPHSGTYVPPYICAKLNALGRKLLDTDWHIPRLYEGLLDDVSVVKATFSRYVIDANRDPQGVSLYPGQNTTELVPTTTFDGHSIWEEPPKDKDITKRLVAFHQPYHAALARALERAKRHHGFAILYDCHSIRSFIPRLFEGRLADLNIGTNGGASCSRGIVDAVEKVCAQNPDFSFVSNGRFKGGWTTRHYGRPQDNIHAIQMELSQAQYLQTEAPPFEYDPARAQKLREVLRCVLAGIKSVAEKYCKTESACGYRA